MIFDHHQQLSRAGHPPRKGRTAGSRIGAPRISVTNAVRQYLVKLGSIPRSEDVRILKHEVLDIKQLIRLALRARLIDNYEIRPATVQLVLAGGLLELDEHDARYFLWGLIRGRERTLAQLKPGHAVKLKPE